MARYERTGVRQSFRADPAFATPEVYECLVEWRQDELFPRVGFIVTTMSVSTERVVHFYDGRGTAELWIKEGKYALNCPNPPEPPQVRGRPGAVGSVHPFEMQGRPPTGRPLTYSADGDRAA